MSSPNSVDQTRFARFHAAPKAHAEFVQAEDMAEPCLYCESMRVVLVMGVFVAKAWLLPPYAMPTIVHSMPPPSAYEDCVSQNINEPALLPGCEALR